MPSDTEITPEWCLNMARLEGNAEIGAGSLDHPLRSLTPTASEATAIGVGEGLSPRALHWRLMGLAATLRSDQFDEDDASARDIEEAARRLAAASPKVASDTAPGVREALVRAQGFIRNGIELGFIRMPDPETPDSAHEVLPLIDAALAASPTASDTDTAIPAGRA